MAAAGWCWTMQAVSLHTDAYMTKHTEADMSTVQKCVCAKGKPCSSGIKHDQILSNQGMHTNGSHTSSVLKHAELDHVKTTRK